jgi:hypothetical protein
MGEENLKEKHTCDINNNNNNNNNINNNSNINNINNHHHQLTETRIPNSPLFISNPSYSSSAPVPSFITPLTKAYQLSTVLIASLGGFSCVFFRYGDLVKNSTGTDVEIGCENYVCQNIILNLSTGIMYICIYLCKYVILSIN